MDGKFALGGNLSSDVLATLATTLTAGFLHADGSHLVVICSFSGSLESWFASFVVGAGC